MFKYTPSIINFTNLEIKKRKFEKKNGKIYNQDKIRKWRRQRA